jgi:hypothetical protein
LISAAVIDSLCHLFSSVLFCLASLNMMDSVQHPCQGPHTAKACVRGIEARWAAAPRCP